MKVTFANTPRLDMGEGDNDWILAADFLVRIEHDDGRAEWVTVPEGFITDLASVPRLPGAYVMFGGKARRSAILHDYLYKTQRGRDFADAVFNQAMRNEVNWFTRQFMYAGVRMFGQAAYDKYGAPKEVIDQPPTEGWIP